MFESQFDNIEKILVEKYKNDPDPWGLDPKKSLADLKFLWPIYKYYFDTKVHGSEKLENDKAYMVISNHTGQIPIDALLICVAFVSELKHPRLLRPLVERFLTSLPFLGKWSSESGAVLGDRTNCLNLLKRNESILVFPEGVPGIAKSPKNYYRLKPFTKGFIRMALQSKVDIVPIAVVGAEDFYPFVFHARKIAKFFKLPALPISPNLIPLPHPVDIYIGDPYSLPKDLDPDCLDEELAPHILHLESEIDRMIQSGLENKRTIKNRFLKR